MCKYIYIDGPMSSCKTTEGLLLALQAVKGGKRVGYIKPKSDVRSSGVFSTHNPLLKNLESLNDQEFFEKVGVETFCFNSMSDITNEIIEKIDMFVIDEAHSFEDIVPYVMVLLEIHDKDVVTITPNVSYKRGNLGSISILKGMCDEHILLKAKCQRCLTNGKKDIDAIFTHKLVDNGEIIEVGGLDKYMAVCRKCFVELNPSNTLDFIDNNYHVGNGSQK